MNRSLVLLTVLIINIIFIGSAVLFLGKVPAIIFSTASIGGFVLWMFTTYKTPVETKKIVIPYLLTVIFFIVHVYEEYITDFEVAMTQITGFHMLEKNFLTIAAFAAPVLWLSGAILIIKKTALGYYFLCFFFVAMAISELSHFIFPFLEDGSFHYVSGMYTAILPLVPASYGLFIMLKSVKLQRLNKI